MASIIVDSARLTSEAIPLLRDVTANSERLHELTERTVRMEDHGVHRVMAGHSGFDHTYHFIGAGVARRASAVRWGVAGDVMVAWIITIPASASIGALFYWFTTFFT